MVRFFFGVAVCLLAGAVGATDIQKIGTVNNPYQLSDSIVVTANRKPTPVREIASQVTVISRSEIESGQAANVADLLRSVGGLEVVQSGGPGRATSVFLRGANSHHTLVLIDGVQMNDPASPNGAFDFAALSVDNIERVEVLHGSHAVLYGSKAIGGVVHILTRSGIGRPSVEVQSEAGSFGSYHESVEISGGNQAWDYAVALSRKDSEGFSAIAERLGGMEADGYNHTEAGLRLNLLAGEQFQLSLAGRLSDIQADIDNSFGVLDDPNYTNRSTAGSLSLRLDRQRNGSRWIPRASLTYSDHRLKSINDPDDDHPGESNRFDSEGTRIKFELAQTMTLTPGHVLNAGIESETEKFHSEYSSASIWNEYGDTVSEVSATTFSGYALYEIAIGSRWFTTVGTRLDRHDLFGEIFSHRLTSAYLLGDGSVKLKASVGSGFKAPSLFQLHHELYGNPELEPEKSESWEAGLEATAQSGEKRFLFGLAFFANEFSNLIVSDPVTFRAINIGEAQSRGVEVSGEFTTPTSEVAVNLTITKPENETDGNPIVRRPEFKTGLTFRRDLGERARLSARLLHVGERRDYDYTAYPSRLIRLDRYSLISLAMSYRLTGQLTFRGRIENILNEDYEEVYGYATPSRSAYAGLKVNL